VILNGEIFTDFSPLSALTKISSFRQNTYNYSFYKEVKNLTEGENKIIVRLIGGQQSKSIIVNYQLPRPNLHVISIGIPAEDLRFSSKDAKDFSKAFGREQEGKLFEKIYITTLTKIEETTKQKIVLQFDNLLNDYFVEKKIKDGDLIIIYISGHSINIKNRFRITGSDFDYMMSRNTSIDFENNILDVIKDIENCRKMIFVDSGLNGAIDGLTSLETNTTVFFAGENFTYEDPEWGNSAFTKTLLEAFSSDVADTNRDGVLYYQELINYTNKRLPEIIKTARPKLKPQIPYLLNKNQSIDFPFFVIPNKN